MFVLSSDVLFGATSHGDCSASINASLYVEPKPTLPKKIYGNNLPENFTHTDVYNLLAWVKGGGMDITDLAYRFFREGSISSLEGTNANVETVVREIKTRNLVFDRVKQTWDRFSIKGFSKLSDLQKQEYFFSTLFVIDFNLTELSFYKKKSSSNIKKFSEDIPSHVGLIMNLIRLGEMSESIDILDLRIAQLLKKFRHALVHGQLSDMSEFYENIQNLRLLLVSQNFSSIQNVTPLSIYVLKKASFFNFNLKRSFDFNTHLTMTENNINTFLKFPNGEYIRTYADVEAFKKGELAPSYDIDDYMNQFHNTLPQILAIYSEYGFDAVEVVDKNRNILLYHLIKLGEVSSQVQKLKNKMQFTNPLRLWLIEKYNFNKIVQHRNKAAHLGVLTDAQLVDIVFPKLLFPAISIIVAQEIGPYKIKGSDTKTDITKENFLEDRLSIKEHYVDFASYTKRYYFSRHKWSMYEFLASHNFEYNYSSNMVLSSMLSNTDSFALADFNDNYKKTLFENLFLNFILPQIEVITYWMLLDSVTYSSSIDNISENYYLADGVITNFLNDKFFTPENINYLFQYFIGQIDSLNLNIDTNWPTTEDNIDIYGIIQRIFENDGLFLNDSFARWLDVESSLILEDDKKVLIQKYVRPIADMFIPYIF